MRRPSPETGAARHFTEGTQNHALLSHMLSGAHIDHLSATNLIPKITNLSHRIKEIEESGHPVTRTQRRAGRITFIRYQLTRFHSAK